MALKIAKSPGRAKPTSDFAAASLLKNSVHGIGGLLDDGMPNLSFKRRWGASLTPAPAELGC